MASDDITPPGKGNPDVHRAQRAFLKSCDASRAVASIAESFAAELDNGKFDENVGIPLLDLDEGDSLVIAIDNASSASKDALETMNTQRSPRAMRPRGVRMKTDGG